MLLMNVSLYKFAGKIAIPSSWSAGEPPYLPVGKKTVDASHGKKLYLPVTNLSI
jgi:hypothetical protein